MKLDGMTAEFPRNSLKAPEKRLVKVLKDVRLRRHFLPLIRAMSGRSEQLQSADRIERCLVACREILQDGGAHAS